MAAQTYAFDAEVDRLFKLVVHSLYGHRDIFLRELISNASDACDRLRYRALTEDGLLGDDQELKIVLSVNKEEKTLTVRDNGIGMTRAELVKNLGTIARSGTQQFLGQLTGEKKKDAQLIGQFGVGFYAAFMVADRVVVVSRAVGKDKAYRWESSGDGKFTVEETEPRGGRGTSVTLHLKDEEKEYLDRFRLRHIVKTYSNHVAFPIVFEDKDREELLNDSKAIWLRNKSEISEREYAEYYQNVGGMGADEPWLTLHNKVEGAVSFTSLLFLPSRRPFNLFHPDRSTSVKLYVKRVFIAEEGLDIVPPYLRFLRGVVDSDDLPLNVSRETVQDSVALRKIRTALTRRVLGELRKKAEKEPEEYRKFWSNFGAVLKEGLCDGLEPRDEIIEACRFQTTLSEDGFVSLQDYVGRMRQGQKAIYYITGDDPESARNSPQLEGFRQRGIEVLLLTDSVDEFWVNVLHEYKGAPLRSVTRADEEDAGKETERPEERKKEEGALAELITFMKEKLGDAVKDVRTTHKLTASPVCLTVPEGAMDIRLERFMIENKQLARPASKILELNPSHPIVLKLAADVEKRRNLEQAEDMAHLLFAQANIIEGEPVHDMAAFTRRLNNFLGRAIAA